jgi:hypothetical protein
VEHSPEDLWTDFSQRFRNRLPTFQPGKKNTLT